MTTFWGLEIKPLAARRGRRRVTPKTTTKGKTGDSNPENKRPRTADEDEDDPNPEVFPDCDAQVLHLMNTGVLFVLLVTSGPLTPGQTAQLNQTRALIGGGTEYVVMDSTPYPNFHAEIGVHRDPPYIVLLREVDALHTFPPHALPQEIADRVAEYAD